MLMQERPSADESLAKLIDAAFQELVDRYGPEGRSCVHPDARFLVAVVDGLAVACGAVQPTGPDPRLGEVKRMYVMPAYRGRGISRALLKALEELAAGLGYDTLRLTTGVRQPEAISLYESSGYARTEPYGKYVHEPLTRCYAKSLRGKAGQTGQSGLTTSGPRHAHAGLDGLVLGDAFGDSWFTRSDENAEEQWAARAPRPGRWLWTDDSAMAFVLFAHLATHGEVRPDGLAREFAAEYERDPGRKYGPSMHGVLRRIGLGEHWQDVTTAQFGGQGSYGNGAAMRVAPLGAWFRDDLAAAREQARLSALTTHAHPEAVAGAVAVAVAAALAAAAEGHDAPPRADFLREVASHLPDTDVRSGLLVAAGFPERTSVRHAASVLGSGTLISAPDTVPFALWSAASHPDGLPEALWQTVAGWGDRDTTCAIAGGVVAARTGTGAVPRRWLQAREDIPAWSRWDPTVTVPVRRQPTS